MNLNELPLGWKPDREQLRLPLGSVLQDMASQVYELATEKLPQFEQPSQVNQLPQHYHALFTLGNNQLLSTHRYLQDSGKSVRQLRMNVLDTKSRERLYGWNVKYTDPDYTSYPDTFHSFTAGGDAHFPYIDEGITAKSVFISSEPKPFVSKANLLLYLNQGPYDIATKIESLALNLNTNYQRFIPVDNLTFQVVSPHTVPIQSLSVEGDLETLRVSDNQGNSSLITVDGRDEEVHISARQEFNDTSAIRRVLISNAALNPAFFLGPFGKMAKVLEYILQ